jgi:hypothetical protein
MFVCMNLYIYVCVYERPAATLLSLKKHIHGRSAESMHELAGCTDGDGWDADPLSKVR